METTRVEDIRKRWQQQEDELITALDRADIPNTEQARPCLLAMLAMRALFEEALTRPGEPGDHGPHEGHEGQEDVQSRNTEGGQLQAEVGSGGRPQGTERAGDTRQPVSPRDGSGLLGGDRAARRSSRPHFFPDPLPAPLPERISTDGPRLLRDVDTALREAALRDSIAAGRRYLDDGPQFSLPADGGE